MKIHLVAPSSPFDLRDYENGKKVLTRMGHDIVAEAKTSKGIHPYLNGSDEERAEALMEALLNKEAQVVWMVRGGYGLTRILSKIKIPEEGLSHKPIVVALSDGSALMSHLYKNWGLNSIHGPCVTVLDKEGPDIHSSLNLLLHGQPESVVYPALSNPDFGHVGVLGTLFVYNLAMMAALIGTDFLPKLENSILCIEDVNESPYEIDRMLTQLYQAGALEGVKAVISGHFHHTKKNAPIKGAHSVIAERMDAFGIPLFRGAFFGHSSPNFPLIFGGKARIAPDEGRFQLKIASGL